MENDFVTKTAIEGLLILKRPMHSDERGFFREIFHINEVEEVRQPARKEVPMARRREEYEEEWTPKKHLLSPGGARNSYDYEPYAQPAAPKRGGGGGLLLYLALIVALAWLSRALMRSAIVSILLAI